MTPDLRHPSTNPNATFALTEPKDTYRLMEALRRENIHFDVTVNGPENDPPYDIFWFKPENDQQKIGDIIRATIPNEN